jgi:hypothetical protein
MASVRESRQGKKSTQKTRSDRSRMFLSYDRSRVDISAMFYNSDDSSQIVTIAIDRSEAEHLRKTLETFLSKAE